MTLAPPDLSDPVLSIRSLVKEYRPGQPVLKDISLDFASRGVTAIIGPSGTGKSTLIRCINRLVDPTSGDILMGETNLAILKGKALRLARRRIGMVFQEYNLVERLSVIENLLSGPMPTSLAPMTCLMRLVLGRNSQPGAPTNSPAASVSVSASPARSCRSRPSSLPMNLHRHSTPKPRSRSWN
jgi:ABC-type Fe3+/spermidine/putrescine transport system ATPase subunit